LEIEKTDEKTYSFFPQMLRSGKMMILRMILGPALTRMVPVVNNLRL